MTRIIAAAPSRHFFSIWLLLAAAIGIPLLLCVAAVIWLDHDTGLLSSAALNRSREIAEIKPQISDLKDYGEIKARLLSGEQILRVLEPASAQSADAVSVFGELPTGLQLRSLEMNGSRVSLAVDASSASKEMALVELLKRNNFRDVQVTHPQSQSQIDLQVATIDATSSRGGAK